MNGIYAIKPLFQRVLNPTAARLVSFGISADTITFSALGLSVAGGIALALSSQQGMLVLLCTTPLLGLLRTVLNALDGMVATKSGTARPWGEVLNEFCDRISDVAIFSGLAYSRFCNGPLLVATLVSVLLCSFLGVLCKACGGPRQFGGVMGKADRMILLSFFGPLAYFMSESGVCSPQLVFDMFLFLVLGGSLLTLWQRARRTYDDLKSVSK